MRNGLESLFKHLKEAFQNDFAIKPQTKAEKPQSNFSLSLALSKKLTIDNGGKASGRRGIADQHRRNVEEPTLRHHVSDEGTLSFNFLFDFIFFLFFQTPLPSPSNLIVNLNFLIIFFYKFYFFDSELYVATICLFD